MAWLINGNTNTTDPANFIGTTAGNNQPLMIKTNGIDRVRITTLSQIETLNTGNGVFIGESAGASFNGSTGFNTFVGYQAGLNTIGVENVAVGSRTFTSNTSGSNNVAIGSGAIQNNTTGDKNTAIGRASMQQNTVGTQNTAVGNASLLNNTTGSDNIAVGNASLLVNTIGSQNTAIGNASLINNVGLNNTAMGYNAGTEVRGNNNTIVGAEAYTFVGPTGFHNSLFGFSTQGLAGAPTFPFQIDGNVVLGAGAQPLTAPTNLVSPIMATGFGSQFVVFDGATGFSSPILSVKATSSAIGGVPTGSTLPALACGFWTVTLGGRDYRIPLYPAVDLP
jgi:hypothetical protein